MTEVKFDKLDKLSGTKTILNEIQPIIKDWQVIFKEITRYPKIKWK